MQIVYCNTCHMVISERDEYDSMLAGGLVITLAHYKQQHPIRYAFYHYVFFPLMHRSSMLRALYAVSIPPAYQYSSYDMDSNIDEIIKRADKKK